MPKSQRLSIQDIQAVWRLLGECRELGADNQVWPQHFVEGMSRLLRSQIGLCHETVLAANGFMELLSSADTGWATAADREFFLRFIRSQGQREPIICRMAGVLLEKETCRREEAIPAPEYYRSFMYQNYFRPTRLDHFVNCGKFTPGARSITAPSSGRWATAPSATGRRPSCGWRTKNWCRSSARRWHRRASRRWPTWRPGSGRCWRACRKGTARSRSPPGWASASPRCIPTSRRCIATSASPGGRSCWRGSCAEPTRAACCRRPCRHRMPPACRGRSRGQRRLALAPAGPTAGLLARFSGQCRASRPLRTTRAEASAEVPADFVLRFYDDRVHELRRLDPEDRTGYQAFLDGRKALAALQAKVKKGGLPALDLTALDTLIKERHLRGETLQDALLLRALAQAKAGRPQDALHSFEVLLAEQSRRTRFDRGDFVPLDAAAIETVGKRIARGKKDPADALAQYHALHRLFEFELPDPNEVCCGHGFRPKFLARGLLGETYGQLLIDTTAKLQGEARARALGQGLEGTGFWRQGPIAQIVDKLLPDLVGREAAARYLPKSYRGWLGR